MSTTSSTILFKRRYFYLVLRHPTVIEGLWRYDLFSIISVSVLGKLGLREVFKKKVSHLLWPLTFTWPPDHYPTFLRPLPNLNLLFSGKTKLHGGRWWWANPELDKNTVFPIIDKPESKSLSKVQAPNPQELNKKKDQKWSIDAIPQESWQDSWRYSWHYSWH